MPIIRVQHSFQGVSGNSKDQYVNTFHLLMASYGSGDLDEVAQDLKDFYEVVPTGSSVHPVSYFLAGQADTAGARIKMVDLSDPKPRTPIFDELYTPTNVFGGSEVPLPSEVACCLSYAAAPVSGVPLARTRGRIYIGPLSTIAIRTAGSAGIARPSADFMNTLAEAGKTLADAWAGLSPVSLWVVYSPTSETYHGIVRWWVDDAWDTQRRRGDRPTERATTSL